MVNSLLDLSLNGAVSKNNKFLRVLPTPKFHNRLALYNLNLIGSLIFVVKSQTTFLCDHGPALFGFRGKKKKCLLREAFMPGNPAHTGEAISAVFTATH
jgi:hypothetical protein